jgi:hypothetical protein
MSWQHYNSNKGWDDFSKAQTKDLDDLLARGVLKLENFGVDKKKSSQRRIRHVDAGTTIVDGSNMTSVLISGTQLGKLLKGELLSSSLNKSAKKASLASVKPKAKKPKTSTSIQSKKSPSKKQVNGPKKRIAKR